ncbi:LytR family transcriptional regulator [Pontibacillus halophilus JSM 076056 = DSM 19796]|uniref:LytR family transcriptional regulator n=1 Tax=Pontibacillus halophilus JSM 076056 = DSM 19796 TaxID=1385510 RepID=A0A0A5GPN5_9BACI|nr:LCP family protein [Pontibacillus halophilus]KGX93939.1 LytR family transcriptional regulator [Pontibacillus halophilus JSM 076056 = DSM 19796]
MKRKRASKVKILLWTLLFVFFLGVGTIAGYGIHLTQKAEEVTEQSQVELERGEVSSKRTKAVDPAEDNISVLFLGIDDSEARSEDTSLSDAMVLATFNKEEHSVKLLSIPRDSYVYIPEVGYKDKITHAHSFGGIDASVETVERMMDVPVDYYVQLNFDAFTETVNALGGIPYDVPFDMTEQNSKDVQGAITLESGMQILNGEEALALARSRQYDSDLARGERQMELLQTIFEKVTDYDSISQYSRLIDSIGNNMNTNLSFDEMTSLHSYATNHDGLQFQQMQLQGEGAFIPLENGRKYVFELDQNYVETTQEELRTHLELANVSSDTHSSQSFNSETSSDSPS